MSVYDEDIQAKRIAAQEHYRSVGQMFLFVSLIFIAAAVIGFLLLTNLLPKNDPQADVPQTLCGIAFFVGFVSLLIAGWSYSQAQPIPNEAFHAPLMPQLARDQKWRTPKAAQPRFLKRLIDEVTQQENRILQCHQTAVEAYQGIPRAVTISEYEKLKKRLSFNETEKQSGMIGLPQRYERIERIFAGDVGAEILDIKEAIRKCQRSKEEDQRIIAQEQARADNCTMPKPCEKCDQWPERRDQLYNHIHQLDRRIIELETDLEELETCNFHELWGDLHMPGPEKLTYVPQAAIEGVKKKVDTLNTIPRLETREPPKPPPTPAKPPSVEDRRSTLHERLKELDRHRAEDLALARTPEDEQRIKNEYAEKYKRLFEERAKLG